MQTIVGLCILLKNKIVSYYKCMYICTSLVDGVSIDK